MLNSYRNSVVVFYNRYKILLNYGCASTILSLVEMVAGFVVLRWINPKDYGLWQSLLIIQSYTLLVQAGVINGLNRELPYAMGKADTNKIQEFAGTAQTMAFFGAALLTLSAFLIHFFIDTKQIAWTASIILICSGIAVLRNYLGATYRAGKAFDTLTIISLCEALMGILSLPCVYFYGYIGLVGRLVVLRLLGFLLSYYFRPLKVPFCINFAVFGTLLKTGLPIFVFSYIFSAANTFPKLILLKQSGVEMVGLFSPALSLTSLFNILPTILARYIYPHMTYRFAQTDDPYSIWSASWKSAYGSFVLGIIFASIGCIFIGPFIEYFFPKYVETIPATYWCLGAGIFLGPRISINALFTLKEWKLATFYTSVFVISSWSFPWVGVVYFKNTLVGAGFGIFASYLSIFLCAIPCVYIATHKKHI